MNPISKNTRTALSIFLTLTLTVSGAFFTIPHAYAAATLLVNTESFFTVDDSDTGDVEVRFGQTLNEKLIWNRGPARFEFTDDVHAQGNITGSGTLKVDGAITTEADLTLNQDQTAADTVITFGSDSTNETAKFLNNEDRFEFSDDVAATGNLTASGTLTVDGVAKTKSDLMLNSDSGAADAVLTFGSDSTNETLKFLNNEDRFEFSDDVNVAGGLYASGALIIGGAGSIKGDFTINSDSGAADTVMTFGSDGTNETLKFLNNEDRFEMSDDIRATGNLHASGGLVIDGAAVFKSTLKLNGVTYTFPTSDGTASGKVLKTNSAGQLSWSTDSAGGATPTRNSGSMIFLNPEYPHAVYFGSGAATASVGTLGLRYDSGSTVNFYRWQTTKTTNQQYWIVTRVRVPDQFTGWEQTKPIEFRYRASGAWLEVRALDTANAPIALVGHKNLKATTWTTATITGPEASGTYTAGGFITLMLKMVSSGAAVTDRAYADASWMNLNLETSN